jgi:hypothetical protein
MTSSSEFIFTTIKGNKKIEVFWDVTPCRMVNTVVTDILKVHSAFIFRARQSNRSGITSREAWIFAA